MEPIQSIHHISATVANANKNVDAGSVMTFFPLSKNINGRVGAGQVRRIAFSVPRDSLGEWRSHFNRLGIDYTTDKSFKATGLFFNDPHGLSLALVETKDTKTDKDVLGFFGVELLSEDPENTLVLLLKDMGLQLMHKDDDYFHLEMTGVEKHRILISRKKIKRGRLGIGTVHHIAWSVPDMEQLSNYQKYFNETYRTTEIKDRKYFKSAYFRDPGHIIYELATEGPGFTVDERFEELGKRLMLPEKYEQMRVEIEAKLPKLTE